MRRWHLPMSLPVWFLLRYGRCLVVQGCRNVYQHEEHWQHFGDVAACLPLPELVESQGEHRARAASHEEDLVFELVWRSSHRRAPHRQLNLGLRGRTPPWDQGIVVQCCVPGAGSPWGRFGSGVPARRQVHVYVPQAVASEDICQRCQYRTFARSCGESCLDGRIPARTCTTRSSLADLCLCRQSPICLPCVWELLDHGALAWVVAGTVVAQLPGSGDEWTRTGPHQVLLLCQAKLDDRLALDQPRMGAGPNACWGCRVVGGAGCRSIGLVGRQVQCVVRPP